MMKKIKLIVERIVLERKKRFGQNTLCWICKNNYEITGQSCNMNKTCKEFLTKLKKYYKGDFIYVPTYYMILKKQRIVDKIRFRRLKYSGYNICDKKCIKIFNCYEYIREACNKIYVYDLKNYCYIYDCQESSSEK